MYGRKRPAQFGVAAIFTPPSSTPLSQHPPFEDFLFSHATLVESHVNKLQEAVERALTGPRSSTKLTEASYNFNLNFPPFLHELTVVLSFQAYLAFRRAILDLYLAKRIQDPVWLSMMTFSAGRKVHICTRFVQEFVIAKEQYEKRNQL